MPNMATIRPIVLSYNLNTLLSLSFTTEFPSARPLKNHTELFSTFLEENHESQMVSRCLSTLLVLQVMYT